MTYSKAGSGLKKVFICQISFVICTILLIHPFPLINFLALMVSCVFLVSRLIGLHETASAVKSCKAAFCLTFAQLLFMFVALSGFLSTNDIKTILAITIYILDFLTLYFVCSSTAKALRIHTYGELAAKGEAVWKLNLGVYAAKIIVSLLIFIPLLHTLVLMIHFITVIVSLIADIQYIAFLYKSSKVL